MGICAQQHRVLIGNNTCFYYKNVTKKSVCVFDGCLTFRQLCAYVFSVSGLIIYIYILCLSMTLLMDITRSDLPHYYYYITTGCLKKKGTSEIFLKSDFLIIFGGPLRVCCFKRFQNYVYQTI